MLNSEIRLKDWLDQTKEFPEQFGRFTHLSVRRFEDNLSNPRYSFDSQTYDKCVRFCELTKTTSGRFAGKFMVLTGWQLFILANLFAMIDNETGLRKYTLAYISMAKKQGKSTFLAAVLLLLLKYFSRFDQSAEILIGANSLKQAMIILKAAKDSAKISGLGRHLKSYTYSITNPKTFSAIKPISSDVTTLDGFDISTAVMDEIHEMKNDNMYNLLRNGMASRKNPCLIMITTAGISLDHFGYQQEGYAKRVLENPGLSENFFALIFSIDDEDDPADESNWVKANPNLGLTTSLKEMREAFAEARLFPTRMATFIAKRLNRYTSQTTNKSWLSEALFRSNVNAITEDRLVGQPCYLALDLSKRFDHTVYSLTFPMQNFFTLWRYFLPIETIPKKTEFENLNYPFWIEQGHMATTPGDIINQDTIFDSIMSDAKKFSVVEVAYDRYDSSRLVKRLAEDGLNCFAFNQSIGSISPAALALELALKERGVSLQDNPIALWNFINAEIYTDVNGNIKPQKGEHEGKKIDGLICLIMGYSRAQNYNEDAKRKASRGSLMDLYR